MEPNTAQAAQAPPAADGSTPAATPTVDDYGFPLAGDLSTDNMSDEELASFVDKSLGIKGGKPSETNTNPDQPTPTDPNPATPPPAPDQPVVPGPGTPDKEPQPATPAPTPAPEEPVAPAGTEPAPQLDTSDLWIDVTNAEGKTVRLSLDAGLPDDFTFTTDKQLYEVLDAFNEMKQLRTDRQAAVNKWQTEQDAKTSETKAQEDRFNSWNNEIATLMDAGIMDKPKLQPTDPNYLKDPAIVAVDKVFEYMRDTNTALAAAGKPLVESFAAAKSLRDKDSKIAADAEAEKQKNELAKRRGAIVGGSSAPTGSDKGYVYKRGSARNIWQVDTSDI